MQGLKRYTVSTACNLYSRGLLISVRTLSSKARPDEEPFWWAPKLRIPPPPKIQLPKQDKADEGKMTVVMDLDETMVHSMFVSRDCDDDYRQEADELRKDATLSNDQLTKISVISDGGKVKVHCRPYLREFLDFIGKHYEPVVYTAAMPIYADPVLDALDPNKTIFRHRLYRHHCTRPRELKGGYCKDLRILGRELSNIVLVDDTPSVFFHQPGIKHYSKLSKLYRIYMFMS
jgi:Dullard-like phosphatase family protein